MSSAINDKSHLRDPVLNGGSLVSTGKCTREEPGSRDKPHSTNRNKGHLVSQHSARPFKHSNGTADRVSEKLAISENQLRYEERTLLKFLTHPIRSVEAGQKYIYKVL